MATVEVCRIRSAEFFAQTIERLSEVIPQEQAASQQEASLAEQIKGYQTTHRGRGRLARSAMAVLDFARIAPIVPRNLQADHQAAEMDHTEIFQKLRFLRNDLELYGANKPGEYNLAMLYLATTYPPGWYPRFAIHLGMEIPLPSGPISRIIAIGEFPRLLYKTTSDETARIKIPPQDQESPTLLLPAGRKVTIGIQRSFGMAMSDMANDYVDWLPTPTSIALPINQQAIANRMV